VEVVGHDVAAGGLGVGAGGQVACRHLGLDHPGGVAVDPDAVGGQLQGQAAGQLDDAGLAGGVRERVRPGQAARDGGGVDDRRVAAAPQVGQGGAGGQVRAAQVDGEHPVPLGGAELLDAEVAGDHGVGDAGVVVQHVQAPGEGGGPFDHLGDRAGVGDVAVHVVGA